MTLSFVWLTGCYDHECKWRARRCHQGQMQECYCETVGGMIAANSCTEARRWRPVRRVAGCIDTPDGPIGARETCREKGMGDYCGKDRSVSCKDSAVGTPLLFYTSCHFGPCRVDEGNTARCVKEADAEPASEAALLLYTTHAVELDGDSLWAPARIPADAQLNTDGGAFLVVLLRDQVRAYRGGNVPISLQETRVMWPRDSHVRFLRDGTVGENELETIVSDAKLALRHQAFWPKGVPHLDAITEASALWHAGESQAALALLDEAIEGAASSDERLLAARAVIAGAP